MLISSTVLFTPSGSGSSYSVLQIPTCVSFHQGVLIPHTRSSLTSFSILPPTRENNIYKLLWKCCLQHCVTLITFISVLFFKFDFKYLQHHTSSPPEITNELLLSVKPAGWVMANLKGSINVLFVKYKLKIVCRFLFYWSSTLWKGTLCT